MRTYHVAWWNLENLFDEENAVALGRRTDKVFRAIKNDIAGWTPELRDRKIDQLATVIAAMNTGQGPDLLGVCEVENRFVVDRLVERVNARLPVPRSYQVVHADTGDARGIDVAFIYDDTLFGVPLPPGVGVLSRGDAPQCHPRNRSGQFQNHHGCRPDLGRLRQPLAKPQRRSIRVRGIPRHCRGDAQLFPRTGPRGTRTPDTGARNGGLQRRTVRHLTRPACTEHPAASQGDFCTGEPAYVESHVAHRCLPDGSFYFENQPNMLDQFLANKNMATGDALIKVNPGTAQILKPPAMVDPGLYPKPIPYGGMGDPVNQNGFSDHFPITMTVNEVE
jgi:Endonuclease/Exonuclease/phosphatase family